MTLISKKKKKINIINAEIKGSLPSSIRKYVRMFSDLILSVMFFLLLMVTDFKDFFSSV